MEETSSQLDNPLLLRIVAVEDKVTKVGDEVLVLELDNVAEGISIHLAHILYKPCSPQSEQENKGRVNNLVRFCQCFGIPTSVPTDTSSWIGKVGRANLDHQLDNYGKLMPRVVEFVPRNLDYTTKLTDESNWRGDKV